MFFGPWNNTQTFKLRRMPLMVNRVFSWLILVSYCASLFLNLTCFFWKDLFGSEKLFFIGKNILLLFSVYSIYKPSTLLGFQYSNMISYKFHVLFPIITISSPWTPDRNVVPIVLYNCWLIAGCFSDVNVTSFFFVKLIRGLHCKFQSNVLSGRPINQCCLHFTNIKRGVVLIVKLIGVLVEQGQIMYIFGAI